MKKIRYLSYPLDKIIPVYGNTKALLGLKSKKSIREGDSCNIFEFSMQNHWGTHIDAPAHFFNKAKTIIDYPSQQWVFRNPCVINLNINKNRIINVSDVKENIKDKHDLLLLKTGFSKFRGTKGYSFNNPLVSPELGIWLRKKRPNISALGIDFVSLGSRMNRALSRESHRAFLNPQGVGKPVLIIEDMDLRYSLSSLKMVIAVPILIRNIDSAPCTVLGIFKKG